MFTLFFVPPESLSNDVIELSGTEARHAISVLRVKAGEVIRLADGKGKWVDGEIVELRKESLSVRVMTRGEDQKPKVSITLAQSLLKGDNQKAAFDQLVQAGVDSILPWRASRSVGSVDKSEKWREVIFAAAKQSRRARIPQILSLSEITDLVESFSNFDLVVALHESAVQQLSSLSTLVQAKKILLIVGPEGGLTDEEVKVFSGAGAAVVKLGDPVIRADLAGALAVGAVSALTGTW